MLEAPIAIACEIIAHQQILEILVDTVDAVDVIATHRHFIDFKYV